MTTPVAGRDVAAAVAWLGLGLCLLLLLPQVRVGWDAAPGAGWGDAVAVVAVCLAQVLRRSRPLLALGLGAVVLLVSGLLADGAALALLIVFADLLFCAVRYGTARASRGVTAAAATLAVVLAFGELLGGGPPAAAVLTLLDMALLLGVPVVWAREVRQHHELAQAERARAEQTRRVAELDREAAVAAERARMARDLHDVIAGQLSGIAIQSEAALSLPDTDDAALRGVLTAIRRDSVAALTEMRAMIGLLRADGTADPATAPAGLDRLGALLEAARGRGLRVEVSDRRTAGGVSAAVDLAAYRIVQEALTNAAKHAPGSAVRLVLREVDGHLVIEVENPLVAGARRGEGTGTGLLGLAERAAAVGGRVEAGADERTWSVRAALPVGAP